MPLPLDINNPSDAKLLMPPRASSKRPRQQLTSREKKNVTRMIIYFGADHRGFELKEHLKTVAKDQGYEIFDYGNTKQDPDDDYPDFAAAVAKRVNMDPELGRGVLVCGSGAGVDIVANKFPNVRSVLALSTDQVYDARHDDDVNVVSFAADFTATPDAQKMLQVFLDTPFGEEERHRRRLEKVGEIANKAPFS